MKRALALWGRLPVLVRAPLLALVVLTSASLPSQLLMQLNLGLWPQLPWAVVPAGLFLWLLWRYIGGWGVPAATASRRKELRRFNPLPATGRLWVWLSGGCLAVTISSFAIIKLLTETGGVQQAAVIDALTALPATTALPLLAMLVAMVAFFEEAAFRGYMQLQLEERYRPAVAIGLTALLFALVHFPAPGQLPLFVFGSLGWGVLTWLSGSIVPAIVMHAAVDGVMFLWAWSQPERFRGLLEHNVMESGIDRLFSVWVAIAVAGTSATIYCFSRLSRHRPQAAG